MKKRTVFFLLSLIFGLVAFTVPGSVNGQAGGYPAATISFTNNPGVRTQAITAGQPVQYTINVQNGFRVCNFYVMLYRTFGRNPAYMNTQPWNRGTTTGTLTGSFNTTGYPEGTYRVFLYGNTDCPDNTVHGNQDDGFACDGNPTCQKYCGVTARPGNNDGNALEPGTEYKTDLYRTASNPAYNNNNPNAWGPNSCGEIKGQSVDVDLTDYRKGQCELKACDPTGQNLDNLSFTIGNPNQHGGVPVANPGGNTGVGTTAPGGNTGVGTIPAGNVNFTKDKEGSAKAPVNSIVLTNTTVANLNPGMSTAATGTQAITLNGQPKNLKTYTGGAITNAQDLLTTTVGGMAVNPVKGTTMIAATTNGTMSITNTNFLEAQLNIPSNTTIFGGTKWDGNLKPPTKVSGAVSAAPQGFKFGDVVWTAGSSETPLLFDRPIEFVVKGAKTGPFGYRAPGGDWREIAKCQGTYAAPTAPAFPGECYITNDVDARILTWHLTDFGELDLNTSVNFIASAGGVCYNKQDPSDVALSVEWGANSGYSCFRLARRECSSLTNCTGPESFTSTFANARVSPPMSYFDPVVESGKLYSYRVWGYRTDSADLVPDCTALGSQLGDNPATYDARFWSLPVVAKASCDGQGSGINIQEYKVVPVQ